VIIIQQVYLFHYIIETILVRTSILGVMLNNMLFT